MVYLRQLNWGEIHPTKPKQKEKSKMNEIVETTVVEEDVEIAEDVEEISQPDVEDVEDTIDSSDEPDNSLVEEIAEAKAKIAQAKTALDEARENLKNIKSTTKREKKKGFCGKSAMDVILATLKEMDGPTSTKDIVSRILDTHRYEGSRQGLNATACVTLNALADVGTIKKEGNRRAAKFQVV